MVGVGQSRRGPRDRTFRRAVRSSDLWLISRSCLLFRPCVETRTDLALRNAPDGNPLRRTARVAPTLDRAVSLRSGAPPPPYAVIEVGHYSA